jgi:hypothetical protein
MSAIRHIAVQVTLYKKADINLDTYHKHTKQQPNNHLAPKQHTKKPKTTKETQPKSKKATVQQTNTN